MFYLNTLSPGGTDFLLRIPLEVVWLYLLHFEIIFTEGAEVWVKVRLFAHRHPTVPAPFVERTILSPLNYLCASARIS